MRACCLANANPCAHAEGGGAARRSSASLPWRRPAWTSPSWYRPPTPYCMALRTCYALSGSTTVGIVLRAVR
eukprot:3779302-Rhodomonas_salina.2